MSTASTPEASQAAPTVKMPILPLLVCILIATVLSVLGSGGAVYLVLRSGRVHAAAEGGAQPPAQAKPAATHQVVLEPLLVNLADEDGHAYLRAGVVLVVQTGSKKEKAAGEEKSGTGIEPVVRDAALDVLGRQRSVDILAPAGKARVKEQLRQKFQTLDLPEPVNDVLFTDFMVQR